MRHFGHPSSETDILRYLEEARQIHGDLQRLLTQISGFSMMMFTSDNRRLLPYDLVDTARDEQARLSERGRALRVPQAALHHHHHLTCALEAVGQSCQAAILCTGSESTDGDRDTLVRSLKAAVSHLRTLATLLPGFEPVAFGQACCAFHAGLAGAAVNKIEGEKDNGGLFDLGAGIRGG